MHQVELCTGISALGMVLKELGVKKCRVVTCLASVELPLLTCKCVFHRLLVSRVTPSSRVLGNLVSHIQVVYAPLAVCVGRMH